LVFIEINKWKRQNRWIFKFNLLNSRFKFCRNKKPRCLLACKTDSVEGIVDRVAEAVVVVSEVTGDVSGSVEEVSEGAETEVDSAVMVQ
jgi:hypothetical protein